MTKTGCSRWPLVSPSLFDFSVVFGVLLLKSIGYQPYLLLFDSFWGFHFIGCQVPSTWHTCGFLDRDLQLDCMWIFVGKRLEQESCQIQTPHPWACHPSPWVLREVQSQFIHLIAEVHPGLQNQEDGPQEQNKIQPWISFEKFLKLSSACQCHQIMSVPCHQFLLCIVPHRPPNLRLSFPKSLVVSLMPGSNIHRRSSIMITALSKWMLVLIPWVLPTWSPKPRGWFRNVMKESRGWKA